MAAKSKRETVVVTGASAGVGRAVVREFAARGARIGLLARDPARLEATRQEVEARGGEALAIPTDMADFEAVERAAAAVEDALGPIDIWINNAMATAIMPLCDTSPEDFRRATEVTYFGYVWGTMAALRRMRPRNRGTIVQVGSALAYRAIPLQSAYCGAKFAIRGFTDSLRCELLHENSDIHLTMVQLPAVNTPQFEWCRTSLIRKPQPVPPIFQPEVVARAIYEAAYRREREITIGGSTLMAIYGNKLAPALADHYLARTGVDAQQSDQPMPPDRPDNLYRPVPGNWAARGSYGTDAKEVSWQAHLNGRRGVAAVAMAAIGGFAAAALALRSHKTT